jgi:hypothetical protein
LPVLGQIPPSLPPFTYRVGITSDKQVDIGFVQASDLSTGDSLQIDPNMQTGYSGIQAAVSATIHKGEENLVEFGNGDFAVSTGVTGRQNTISEVKLGNHEELYGVKAGGSAKDDLGDASMAMTWKEALEGGYSTQQGTQDLKTLISRGLGGINQVAATFGFGSGSAGVQQSIGGLMNNAQEQVRLAGTDAPDGAKSRLDALSKLLNIAPVTA